MKIYEKLQQARDFIKSQKIDKDGMNEFAKYKYFKPTYVSNLVYTACKQSGLITKFDLIRDQFGLTGLLTIYTVSDEKDFIPETIEFKMATDIPQIKATNITQQIGGAVTYTQRYLEMVAFGIVENDADFDSQNNGATSKMISEISSLLFTSSISDANAKKIMNEMDDYDMERAEKCISYLKMNQKDPMESANPSATDIKNHVKKISQ